jgi:hypothetical protein
VAEFEIVSVKGGKKSYNNMDASEIQIRDQRRDEQQTAGKAAQPRGWRIDLGRQKDAGEAKQETDEAC